jgi:SulP family sulfate permease
LVPLSVALVIVNGLGFTQVFLVVGLFYLATGLYFNLPIPVQPLKVVAAIAIAFPEKITLTVMSAAGLLFGVILLVLALSGTIDWLSRVFTKPIVRGIQLGLGFMLIMKGIEFIEKPGLFIDAGAGSV